MADTYIKTLTFDNYQVAPTTVTNAITHTPATVQGDAPQPQPLNTLLDQIVDELATLPEYRKASEQDVIDNSKEAKGKITISGVEKTASTHTVTVVTDGVTSTFTLVGVS